MCPETENLNPIQGYEQLKTSISDIYRLSTGRDFSHELLGEIDAFSILGEIATTSPRENAYLWIDSLLKGYSLFQDREITPIDPNQREVLATTFTLIEKLQRLPIESRPEFLNNYMLATTLSLALDHDQFDNFQKALIPTLDMNRSGVAQHLIDVFRIMNFPLEEESLEQFQFRMNLYQFLRTIQTPAESANKDIISMQNALGGYIEAAETTGAVMNSLCEDNNVLGEFGLNTETVLGSTYRVKSPDTNKPDNNDFLAGTIIMRPGNKLAFIGDAICNHFQTEEPTSKIFTLTLTDDRNVDLIITSAIKTEGVSQHGHHSTGGYDLLLLRGRATIEGQDFPIELQITESNSDTYVIDANCERALCANLSQLEDSAYFARVPNPACRYIARLAWQNSDEARYDNWMLVPDLLLLAGASTKERESHIYQQQQVNKYYLINGNLPGKEKLRRARDLIAKMNTASKMLLYNGRYAYAINEMLLLENKRTYTINELSLGLEEGKQLFFPDSNIFQIRSQFAKQVTRPQQGSALDSELLNQNLDLFSAFVQKYTANKNNIPILKYFTTRVFIDGSISREGFNQIMASLEK